MKKKIVMEVPMNCPKLKTKAMKIAAGENGVGSVAFEGTDKMVVTGDEVDPVELARALKKKFRYVMLVRVDEEKDKKDDDEKKTELTPAPWSSPYGYGYVHQCPHPPAYDALAVYDYPSPTTCTIL